MKREDDTARKAQPQRNRDSYTEKITETVQKH